MTDDMLLKKSEENTSDNDEVKQIVRYLHISGITEEFIALQLDLHITIVKDILKELSLCYKPESMIGLK